MRQTESTPPVSITISDNTMPAPVAEKSLPRWRSRMGHIHSKESRRSVGKFLLLWLRLAWLDILAMLVILAISYVFKDHVPVFRQNRRTFAMWRDGPDDWYGETYISHAKQPLVLSNLAAALIFVAVPIGIILFMQIFIRNFWDAHTAIFGLLQALITMYV